MRKGVLIIFVLTLLVFSLAFITPEDDELPEDTELSAEELAAAEEAAAAADGSILDFRSELKPGSNGFFKDGLGTASCRLLSVA